MAQDVRPVEKRNDRIGCFVLVGAVVVIGLIFALDAPNKGAGGSSAGDPGVPAGGSAALVAARLSDSDSAEGHPHPVEEYVAQLDVLGPKCTQDVVGIGGIADSAVGDLVKNGVTDEDRLSVLRHLAMAVPAGLGRTDCVGIVSAYLVLREG